VVQEGYEELRLRDARVEALLASTAKVEPLKRCRNGRFIFRRIILTSGFSVRCENRILCNGSAPSPRLFGMMKRYYWCFDDPAKATGSEEEVFAVFRRVRDEIGKVFAAYAAGINLGTHLYR
jgi:hypothetical protein